MPHNTDTASLDAGEIRIPTADFELPGYYSMPTGGRNLPVVLVVQEIFGVNAHIQDLCRRLGKLGYMAIAPEMYARQGDVSKIAETGEIIAKVVSKVPDAQVMADLDAVVGWADQSGKADTARLAITGFCWGGRIVWLYAAHTSRVKAGVAWYGRLVGDKDPLHPSHPVDIAMELQAPVLGLYGALDKGIPVATVGQMREALRKAGKVEEFVVYPKAGHAFHADYRPSYVEDAARDGWKRMLAWFRQHGV